ncbi:MAG: DNA-processing protein DprA [Fimbriimonadaceae bacterium]|nr:DNA-processing protein DprA [Fimbriimonadaceae bacterium]
MRTLFTVALTTHLIPGRNSVPPKIWRELRGCVASASSAEEVIEYSNRVLAPTDATRVAACFEDLHEYEDALATLSETDISCVTEFDDNYPQNWIRKLSGKHPAAIFGSGNLPLLNARSIGIVGSRAVDDAGAAFARQVSQEAVRLGFIVISGGAKGVDQVATEAAIAAGGEAVEIVPDSMLRRVLAGLSGPNRLLVTPYQPDAGFSAGNAMGRNKLIYALSSGTVVVSSSLGTGGTWSGAKEAIMKRFCPVLVRSAENAPPGNRALIELGGRLLGDVGELEAVLESSEPGALF